MLEALTRRNTRLELDLMRLLKKHLGRTNERVTDEQLAFLFSLLPGPEVAPDEPVPAPGVAPLGTDAAPPPCSPSATPGDRRRVLSHGRARCAKSRTRGMLVRA